MEAKPNRDCDPLAVQHWIDRICDHYEAAWQNGSGLPVDEYLRAEGQDPAAADAELLKALRDLEEDYCSKGTAKPLAISGYEILEEIGRGGMGVVYVSVHTPD